LTRVKEVYNSFLKARLNEQALLLHSWHLSQTLSHLSDFYTDIKGQVRYFTIKALF